MKFYINTDTMEYGVTKAQIKALYPQTSFPKQFKPMGPFKEVMQTSLPALGIFERAIDTKNPELIDGVYYQKWQIVDKYNTYTDEEGVTHTKEDQEAEAFENSKLKKLKELNTYAKTKEEEGITLPDGFFARTNEKTQIRLTQAMQQVQINPDVTFNWKLADGRWTVLDATQIAQIQDAVLAHVQACFTREKELADIINASLEPQTLNIAKLW